MLNKVSFSQFIHLDVALVVRNFCKLLISNRMVNHIHLELHKNNLSNFPHNIHTFTHSLSALSWSNIFSFLLVRFISHSEHKHALPRNRCKFLFSFLFSHLLAFAHWCFFQFFSQHDIFSTSKLMLIASFFCCCCLTLNSIISAKHTKLFETQNGKFRLHFQSLIGSIFLFSVDSVVQHTNRYDMQKTEHFALGWGVCVDTNGFFFVVSFSSCFYAFSFVSFCSFCLLISVDLIRQKKKKKKKNQPTNQQTHWINRVLLPICDDCLFDFIFLRIFPLNIFLRRIYIHIELRVVHVVGKSLCTRPKSTSFHRNI